MAAKELDIREDIPARENSQISKLGTVSYSDQTGPRTV